LDETVILAIAYDRNIQTDYDVIRYDLTQLAESAKAEEATGFDPSGLSSSAHFEGRFLDDDVAPGSGIGSGNGMSLSDLDLTENGTTVSDGSGSSFFEQPPQKFTEQADMGELEKIDALRQIFPNFGDHTFKIYLQRNKGDLDRTFDELLNRQHLMELGELPKGVDGFFVGPDDESRRPSKGKKRKAKANRSLEDSGGGARSNKLALDYAVVSPTIDEAELEGAKGPVIKPATYAPVTRFEPPPLKLIKRPATMATTSSTSTSSEYGTSSSRGAISRLNRLGPLGRQGAIVYTERAREEARVSAAMSFQSAERLVNQQSTASKIDLHGVTVLDGVRIAKHRVWQWWDNLGENRESTARQVGFTVITGIGRHSVNGVSRLRQAVGVALKNDGWRMETLTGQFYITGRM
ncbi:hypothetical protein B0T17DRAFT_489012, partial [Bombardia bombarda]